MPKSIDFFIDYMYVSILFKRRLNIECSAHIHVFNWKVNFKFSFILKKGIFFVINFRKKVVKKLYEHNLWKYNFGRIFCELFVAGGCLMFGSHRGNPDSPNSLQKEPRTSYLRFHSHLTLTNQPHYYLRALLFSHLWASESVNQWVSQRVSE